MKKILILLLSVICVLLVVPLNTLTDDNSDTYEYTIRVFAGDKGAFSDGSAVKTIHARYGEEVNLSDYLVVPTENRYLFNGYRTSGRDNRWAELPAFTAEKDVDYVAAYVIKGNVVHYTLRFVEYGTGRQLLADMVLEGNAGDKPIEAFRYVEGYRPLYRNITKTLSDNEAENVFVFEYVEIPAQEGGEAGGAGAGGAGAEAGGAGAGGAGTEGAGGAGTGGAGGNPEAPETQEILDIDTPQGTPGADVPESKPENVEPPKGNGAKIGWIIGGVALAVVAAALIVILTRKKRK